MSGFNYFLDEFIKTILITDSLNSVNEDENTRFDFTYILKPKQAFDLLRENIINKSITVFERDDLFFSGTLNNKLFLKLFRFKQDEFISTDKFSQELGPNYSPPCFHFFLWNWHPNSLAADSRAP